MENIQDIYPLSPMQEGMLFHSIYSPDSEEYQEQFSCRLDGPLEIDAFKSAWEKIIERHDILRTAFVWEEVDEPLQVVHTEVELSFYFHDISENADKEPKIEELIDASKKEKFDLSDAPLMRITLIKLKSDEHYLIWDHHHLLFDGWGLPVLMQELMSIYKSTINNEQLSLPATYPYKNYIAWIQSQDEEKSREFWIERLKSFYNPTKIKLPLTEAPIQGYSKIRIMLNNDLVDKIHEINTKEKITTNTIIQAAWSLVLSYYTGEEDVVFGATLSGRNADIPGIESMIGLFINTLPVRAVINKSQEIGEWLKEFQLAQSQLQEYEYSALFKVQSWSEIPKGESLFNTIIVLENYPVGESLSKSDVTLKIKDVKTVERTNYPLTLVVSPGKRIGLEIAYDTEYFDEYAVSQILKRYQIVLNQILVKLHSSIDQIDFLTENEKNSQINIASGNRKSRIQFNDLSEWLEQVVKDSPDKTAAVDDIGSITYSELNKKANQLAHFLIKKSVSPEGIVGICVERSIDMIIAMAGVNKTGAAFLPIDINYPIDRIKYIVKDSGLDLLIADDSILNKLNFSSEIKIAQNELKNLTGKYSIENPKVSIDEQNISYLIYTSGSTGLPKAVALTQKGLCGFIDDAISDFEYNNSEKVLQFSSFGFDASVGEIYSSLLSGSTLYIPKREITLSEKDLSEYINDNEITIAHLTPSYLSVIESKNMNNNLKIACVGDRCPAELAEKWGERFQFYNGYGPTETTIGATYLRYRKSFLSVNSFPIGKGFGNVNVYILDDNLNFVSIGVSGEIFIGGRGVGRGYLNNPSLTSERFIPDLYSDKPGERIYKTGDVARYLPDGNIEFIGRRDYQVKIRGYRIELNEIDAAIQRHSEVKDSVVVEIKEEKGNEYLAAYVIREDESLTKEEILEYIGAELPNYMSPRTITFLDEFPLTPSKKVDRKKLPRPDKSETIKTYTPPESATEEIVANIWCDILKIDKAGRNDNFFELGGHSLLATQLISRLRETFQREIPFQVIFESNDLKEIALKIDQENFDAVQAGQEINKVNRDQFLPLSYSQQRLWFLDQLKPNDPSYNIPTVFRLEGEINIDHLERAFNLMIERHEILRTSFQEQAGKPFQKIESSDEISIDIIEMSGDSTDDKLKEAKNSILNKSAEPFDLSTLPLFRCQLYRIDKEDHILFILMHHIISDGWSLSILVKEFVEYYVELISNREPVPKKLDINFADYAYWQQSNFEKAFFDDQLNYWKTALRDIPPLLELPYDKPKPKIQSFNSDQVKFQIDGDDLSQLTRITRAENATLFMTMISIFQILLAKYSNMQDIVVGTPIAGRNYSQLENLIGFFVNNLAIRGKLHSKMSFNDFLVQVRETTLKAYANQAYPFDKLVEELQPVRDLSHQPIFQVMFVFQNIPSETVKLDKLNLIPFEFETRTTNFDITLTMQEFNGGIIGVFDYNTDLFEKSTIKRFAEHYKLLVKEILNNPDIQFEDIVLLTQSEKKIIRDQLKDEPAYITGEHVVGKFENIVNEYSECDAVVYKSVDDPKGDSSLTYSQMNERVNQLSRLLIEEGVGTEDKVAICMDRHVNMIISMFAVLKTGAAFVPIDPSLPKDRIDYMLNTVNGKVILTNIDNHELFNGRKVVNLDRVEGYLNSLDSSNLNIDFSSDNLAYIIFTSGSTGQPKGVMLNHCGLVNLSYVQREAFNLSEKKRVMQFSSLSFDASVWETVMALLNGASLYLTSKDVITSGTELAKYLSNNRITTITLPPSVLAVLPNIELPQLDTLITAGEAISNELVGRWKNGRTYFNAYGPTETTVCATMFSPDKEYPKGPPIGNAVSNFSTYILNSELNPAGIGIPGELCIGGIGLARGYIGQPDLTAEKFIPNTFSKNPGDRLYRTGDLAKLLPDGNIEFLGRIDTQIKLRGFRIEVGEIEQNLKSIDTIKDAVVELKKISENQEKLIAYIVTDEIDFDKDFTLNVLKDKLPDYMIPSAILKLDEFPLTASGKVNRRALPVPALSREELGTEYIAPRNEDESKLVMIVEDLLSVEKVGIKDNFFELGGHSLLATQFISRIRDEFNKEIKLINLFEDPTIEGVYKSLQNITMDQTSKRLTISKISRDGRKVKRTDIN